MSEYTQQADNFLAKHNLRFRATLTGHDYYFADDAEPRDIYRATVYSKGRGRIAIRFGQSLNDTRTGTAPTAYDVLACIEKNDPGTFEDFCGNYGYDEDSRKALKTYRAVVRQWRKVEAFFTPDEIEELQEIS